MRRKAFTMVELLTVMVIISLLAALLLPALAAAIRAGKNATAAAEIGGLTTAIASFSLSYDRIPPSYLVASETGDYSDAYLIAKMSAGDAARAVSVKTRTLDALSTMFPRMKYSLTTIPAGSSLGIPGIGWYDFNGNGKLDPPYLIDGAECLTLFLGGVPAPYRDNGVLKFGAIGLASDPRNPFQPATYTPDPTKPFNVITPARKPAAFDFASGRLFDLDDDGIPSFVDSIAGAPYAYFANEGGAYDPGDIDYAFELSDVATPVLGFSGNPWVGRPGIISGRTDLRQSQAPNPYCRGQILPVSASGGIAPVPQMVLWINPNTYQIICAGADGDYGVGGRVEVSTTPLPFDYAANAQVTGTSVEDRVAERDNITNFAKGSIGQ